MNYIIFDMEWNQPSSAKEKNPDLVRGEIIQIGFFVLNQNFDILHNEDMLIKPICYKSINQYVGLLTGISQKMLNNGITFEAALRKMAQFFDENTLLFTWGDDDIPILNENMRFHKIEDVTLPKHFNLQRFYSIQTNAETRQTALKTAAEHFGIEADIQAHDALNDAYLTLLVAKKLDISRGIEEYDKAVQKKNSKVQNPWQNDRLVFTSSQEYNKHPGSIPDTCRSISIPCEDCGSDIIFSSLCRHGRYGFVTTTECVCANRYFAHFELVENTLTANIYELSNKTEKFYENKLRAKETRKRYYQAKKKKK